MLFGGGCEEALNYREKVKTGIEFNQNLAVGFSWAEDGGVGLFLPPLLLSRHGSLHQAAAKEQSPRIPARFLRLRTVPLCMLPRNSPPQSLQDAN